MPTARELLEQADALMRRNRAGASPRSPIAPPTESRIPPTTSNGVIASPRPIQREPIASSLVHTSLPLVDADASDFTEPGVQAALPPPANETGPVAEVAAPTDDGDFPVLTDAVAERSTAAGSDTDNLPVLTDVVNAVGAVGVEDEARGEPSLWELTSGGDRSPLRGTPDSILGAPTAGVPRPVPQAPPEGRDPLGLDQPAPGFRIQEAIAPVARDAASMAPGAEENAPADEDTDEPHVFSAAVSHMAPEDAEEAVVASEQHWDDAGAEERSQPPLPGEARPVDEPDRDVYGGEAFAAARDGQPGNLQPVAAPSTIATPEPAPDLEQQRIREIAEEIGMQVLQRIDIFTDTTLRAQLGERLRPVVDRAAADLVAAINEHIGDLLRAQISEAIEREIESWKKDR